MEIVILPAGPIQTNAYLIINKTTNEAVAVDAGPEAFDVISEESKNYGVDLKGLLITHPHWDHIGDIHKFNDAGVPVYAHEEALSWISDAESQRSISMPGLELKNGSVEKVLKHDDSFDMAGIRFEVRFAPGHCPGSVLFYLPDGGCCFTGDVIFDGSVGRTDLPGGDMEILMKSIINQVYTLPDETILYPGHGSSTLVGKEKISNPFVTV